MKPVPLVDLVDFHNCSGFRNKIFPQRIAAGRYPAAGDLAGGLHFWFSSSILVAICCGFVVVIGRGRTSAPHRKIGASCNRVAPSRTSRSLVYRTTINMSSQDSAGSDRVCKLRDVFVSWPAAPLRARYLYIYRQSEQYCNDASNRWSEWELSPRLL